MTPELLLPAAFAAGFFGSSHCLAMCGAVVVLLEGQGAASGQGLRRRLLYNLGRLCFYILLGVLAGAFGQLLAAGVDTGLVVLRYLSAALIVALGLHLLLDWQALRFLERAGAKLWQGLAPLARHVLPISSPATALAAGFLWGALPCGLVYSAVAMAATAGSAAAGGLVMLAFGLGTLPALLLGGASASTLHRWKRRPLLRRVAGMLMIAIGLLALTALTTHRTTDHGRHSHNDSPAAQAASCDRRPECDLRNVTGFKY
jgi:hypothetical protein